MEDITCRSVPGCLRVVDITQRHANDSIRSFQNLTAHRCYRQLSCPPEAFSSLALRRGPQSHSSENDLPGGQQCQKRVLIAGSLLLLVLAWKP